MKSCAYLDDYLYSRNNIRIAHVTNIETPQSNMTPRAFPKFLLKRPKFLVLSGLVFDSVASQARALLSKYDAGADFGRHRVLMRTEDFLREHGALINDLIDFVYVTGMEIRQVNPSEVQGYT